MNRFFRNAWSMLFAVPTGPLLSVTLVAAFVLAAAWPVRAETGQELTVSAAASLKNAFEDMGKVFQSQRKGAKIYFNFGSSGDLLRQIVGGAPVDVFASAAQREMDELETKNLIISGTRLSFARNEIVLARPAKSAHRVTRFEDLKKPEIKLISIGNPASVPAGLYAAETLKYLKIWDDIKGKFVFGESTRQVLDYIARGEVDAGIIFSTDARSRSNEVTIVSAAPAGSHRPIVYPMAVVKGSKQEALAVDFIRFVVSEPGRKILERHGFSRSE